MKVNAPIADLQALFIKKGWSLALAESCTGGRLAAEVTSQPGSSAYFLGSLVTYSNSVKQALLRVPASLLEEHGAVSESVVKAMAEGARNILQSDWAVAVSGIAGPDGGSENKPVGLVFFSVVGPKIDWQSRQVFNGDRKTVMHAAVEFALNALWRLANEEVKTQESH